MSTKLCAFCNIGVAVLGGKYCSNDCKRINARLRENVSFIKNYKDKLVRIDQELEEIEKIRNLRGKEVLAGSICESPNIMEFLNRGFWSGIQCDVCQKQTVEFYSPHNRRYLCPNLHKTERKEEEEEDYTDDGF